MACLACMFADNGHELVHLFAGDCHSFVDVCSMASADGPDAGRVLIGVKPASFEGVDKDVCGFGCFHDDDDIKDSRLTRVGRESVEEVADAYLKSLA